MGPAVGTARTQSAVRTSWSPDPEAIAERVEEVSELDHAVVRDGYGHRGPELLGVFECRVHVVKVNVGDGPVLPADPGGVPQAASIAMQADL